MVSDSGRLSGPYREKLDCSSANQITGFRGKPDWEKINKFINRIDMSVCVSYENGYHNGTRDQC